MNGIVVIAGIVLIQFSTFSLLDFVGPDLSQLPQANTVPPGVQVVRSRFLGSATMMNAMTSATSTAGQNAVSKTILREGNAPRDAPNATITTTARRRSTTTTTETTATTGEREGTITIEVIRATVTDTGIGDRTGRAATTGTANLED